MLDWLLYRLYTKSMKEGVNIQTSLVQINPRSHLSDQSSLCLCCLVFYNFVTLQTLYSWFLILYSMMGTQPQTFQAEFESISETRCGRFCLVWNVFPWAWRNRGHIPQLTIHPHCLLSTLVPPTVSTTPFNALSPTQSHRSCSGTEAGLEEMPTSPHVSKCRLCDLERYFLSWLLVRRHFH